MCPPRGEKGGARFLVFSTGGSTALRVGISSRLCPLGGSTALGGEVAVPVGVHQWAVLYGKSCGPVPSCVYQGEALPRG